MTGEQTLQGVPEVDMALHRARIEEAERRMHRSGWRREVMPTRGTHRGEGALSVSFSTYQ